MATVQGIAGAAGERRFAGGFSDLRRDCDGFGSVFVIPAKCLGDFFGNESDGDLLCGAGHSF